jgi:hypothetical protein
MNAAKPMLQIKNRAIQIVFKDALKNPVTFVLTVGFASIAVMVTEFTFELILDDFLYTEVLVTVFIPEKLILTGGLAFTATEFTLELILVEFLYSEVLVTVFIPEKLVFTGGLAFTATEFTLELILDDYL